MAGFVNGGIVLIFMLLFLVAVPVVTGVLVYRDAKARQMDAVLWTLVAVLVPSLIGLIIYMVVRRNHPALRCKLCGNHVQEEHMVCSQCGAALKYRCAQCGTAVEPSWAACPMCGAAQPTGREELRVTDEGGAKMLWVLLIVVVAVPILFVILGVLLYGVNTLTFRL
ncbi:zinc ribbon domain-containing protein [Christensenellaceae bacterium OttesenSCG-928-L17]|nr:zinc ribbon domain-containing protein [Christensenellaceae bacterium OttesenSCG-928-L17]